MCVKMKIAPQHKMAVSQLIVMNRFGKIEDVERRKSAS